MLNTAEHEVTTAHKTFLALSLSDAVFIMLINVTMPTNVGCECASWNGLAKVCQNLTGLLNCQICPKSTNKNKNTCHFNNTASRKDEVPIAIVI